MTRARAALTSSRPTGFTRYSDAPEGEAPPALVEHGHHDHRDRRWSHGSALRRARRSQPSSLGSRMSSTAAAGSTRRMVSSPSCPSWAVTISTPASSEVEREQVERTPIVLDDDDLRHLRRSAPGRRPSPLTSAARWRRSGWRSRRCFPSPTSLSTQMRPPCSSTMRLESVRPRPVPSALVDAAAALLERLEDAPAIVRRRCLGPSSATVTVSSAPSLDARTSTRPPSLRELHRVGQQVEHDLLEAELVGPDLFHSGLDHDVDRDAVLGRPLAHEGVRVLQGVVHREGARLEVHPTGLDLGQVQDLVEQLEQVLARRPDVVEVLLLPLVDVAEHPGRAGPRRSR